MTLKLTSKGAVRFSWADESMEALFTLHPSDSEEELTEKLRRMLAFVEDRRRPPLPERIPGMALGMAQTAHPAPGIADWGGSIQGPDVSGGDARPTNGWAAMAEPEIPERLQGEVELIPPGEGE